MQKKFRQQIGCLNGGDIMGDIIFHVLLLVVLGVFFKESLLIDMGRTTDPIGPAGFPQGIMVITIVLTVISLFQTIRKRKAEPAADTPHKPQELTKEFIGLLASIILFVLLVDTLGFIVAFILFTFGLLLLLGERKYGKMAGISVAVSIGFALLFGNLLSVPLPRGVEILKLLSYYLY